MFSEFLNLESDRLYLRKIALDDASELFRIGSDPEVTKYLSWTTHRSPTDAERFINAMLLAYVRDGQDTWSILRKPDRLYVGICGFTNLHAAHARAEIWFVTAREFWGCGYATEAASLVVQYGFDLLDLHRIEATCMVENLASARVMEKLGMTPEGVLREYLRCKDNYVDMRIFSLLRSEWNGKIPLFPSQWATYGEKPP